MAKEKIIEEIVKEKIQKVKDLNLEIDVLYLIFGSVGMDGAVSWATDKSARQEKFNNELGIESINKIHKAEDVNCDFYNLATKEFKIAFGFTSHNKWNEVHDSENMGKGKLYFYFNEKLVLEFDVINHTTDNSTYPTITTDRIVKFYDGEWVKLVKGFIGNIRALNNKNMEAFRLSNGKNNSDTLKDNFNITDEDIENKKLLRFTEYIKKLPNRLFDLIADLLAPLILELFPLIVGVLILGAIIGIIIFGWKQIF